MTCIQEQTMKNTYHKGKEYTNYQNIALLSYFYQKERKKGKEVVTIFICFQLICFITHNCDLSNGPAWLDNSNITH